MDEIRLEDWEARAPPSLRADSLWNVKAYRLALYLADLAWRDSAHLRRTAAGRALHDQLLRATASIGANIAEGYSRGTGKDRARFYEYALGSARESRDWYFKCRAALREEVVTARLNALSEVVRLLLAMIPDQRKQMRDDSADYDV